MLSLLDKICASLHLQTNPDFSAKIDAYLTLLDRWNKAYNLTAVLDPRQRMIRHIADSLSVAPYLYAALASPSRCLDVGTGAGLPGIPLSLLFPDTHWILLDSHSKKTHFLVQVKAQLGLDNVDIVHARIEHYRPTKKIGHIITRAWTALSQIVDKTQHVFEGHAGTIWAMKGIYPTQELNDLAVLSPSYETYPLIVPELAEERHLIKIAISV